jgi:hypothetical protein
MRICPQMALTNVCHATVGSSSLEKNWKNTIKSNIVRVLSDLPFDLFYNFKNSPLEMLEF